MKVFISFDMEGVAGIVDWSQCRAPGQPYEEGRRLLLGEVNAAVDGAMAAGATEIVCNDSHGTMNNLDPAALHGHATYVSGRHKPLYMMMQRSTRFSAIHNQAEFKQQLWQYLNRATTDWKITAGKAATQQYAPLFARIEKDFGVEPAFMLGVWGIESAFGDPVVEKNHMRPVIPSLAALAWAEPRRRAYWEGELINALIIVQRGMATPEQMIGSWAGAMGHTQWMPEVWLNVGIDYDGDGRIFPYGPPDDALASTARFFVERGKYRRGEHWGFEVRMPASLHGHGSRTYAAWQAIGVARADGLPYPQLDAKAQPWIPVPGGPAFLLGANFFAAKSYNPSMSYALALVYLGDRCSSGRPFVQKFPGSEPGPTLAEVQEIQQRLTAIGLRYRRHRRPYRQRHHARCAEFPAQSRHFASRRLCRGGTTRPVASSLVIRLDAAHQPL